MADEFYVYVYFRPDTGEPCYIGKGKGRRLLRHGEGFGSVHLGRIIKKAGGEIPFAKTHVGLSEADALKIEIALIKAIGRQPNGPLVNLTDGWEGNSGWVPPPETRAKMSAAQMGRKLSPERLAKNSASHKGLKHSLETRAKLAAVLHSPAAREKALIMIRSPEVRAKIGAASRGRLASPETRAKMSATVKGRIKSAEHRANLSIAHKGKVLTPQHRAKLSAAHMGNVPTAETRAKLSAGAFRQWSLIRESRNG